MILKMGIPKTNVPHPLVLGKNKEPPTLEQRSPANRRPSCIGYDSQGWTARSPALRKFRAHSNLGWSGRIRLGAAWLNRVCRSGSIPAV